MLSDPIADPVLSVAALPLVALAGVTKSYGSKTALQEVSLTIPAGQICGLLGPNGAGKTTLFRLLMGILKATQGTLLVDGLDAFEDRVAVKRLVGFLPDEPVFHFYLDVAAKSLRKFDVGRFDSCNSLILNTCVLAKNVVLDLLRLHLFIRARGAGTQWWVAWTDHPGDHGTNDAADQTARDD